MAQHPAGQAARYAIAFGVPGGTRPITREGELVVCDDGTGYLTTTDRAGLLAPRALRLSRREVRFYRRVLAFWLAPAACRHASAPTQGD